MAELKTRIKHKNGTPDEWSQATNFSPLKGELVVYNDATNPRMKIGDGETNVNDLPFINNAFDAITASKTTVSVRNEDKYPGIDIYGSSESDGIQKGFQGSIRLSMNTDHDGYREIELVDSTHMKACKILTEKYGTAVNSSKLGGKPPEYYIQPRNLLDNSDFRKPVNQRGNTEITGDWNYGIDRWLVSTKYEQNPNGSILITDNGLSMGYWTDMMQLIPFEQLKSKTLTFAVCTENGVYAYTMTLPESVPPVGGGVMYFGDGIWNDIIVMETIKYDNNDSVMFRFRNAQTTNQLVYWAALYEGSYTAETLPEYQPKGYGVELLECQRYYYVNRNWTRACAKANQANVAHFNLQFPIPMRAIPSLQYDVVEGTQPTEIKANIYGISSWSDSGHYTISNISATADL